MTEKIDFDSSEWMEKLKNKSPEEIAEIVENYYEEKYKSFSFFSWKKTLIIVFLSLLLIISLVVISILLKNA
jgi:hypothetical protein